MSPKAPVTAGESIAAGERTAVSRTPRVETDFASSAEIGARHPRSRRLWWFGAVALVLILALTPPLLNVNRLRRRIAASMSASIGRPVYLDSAALHLLPVPGFTLTNMVVAEDPAFGYEPTIRAMKVEATLRPSSLWRRHVEFSTIRFVDPSLNLVRNAQGRWNLQSLLVHAAKVDTAPTAQSKAGPAPRFPYIEATGARVNLKLVQEKQPFSLTDADFALWLPSPQQWQVRLKGKPARTDSNISDPGIMRLEGSLERAGNMATVPVELTASWRDAPLGEASRLLSGTDAGWRGTLDWDATLTGDLGAAKLTSSVHVNDLRRADFVPPRLLDLNLDCSATAEVTVAVLHDPECLLQSPRINAIADTVDLTNAAATGIRIGSPGIPQRWVLDWARLFSQRIPAAESGAGEVGGSVGYVPPSAGRRASWQGAIHGDLPAALPGFPMSSGQVSNSSEHPQFSISSDGGAAVLAPIDLTGGSAAGALVLSGSATTRGYTLRLEGTATAQQIRSLRAMAPPLTDGLEQALPLPTPALDDAGKPLRINVTCGRLWGAAQTCAEGAAAPVKRMRSRRRR